MGAGNHGHGRACPGVCRDQSTEDEARMSENRVAVGLTVGGSHGSLPPPPGFSSMMSQWTLCPPPLPHRASFSLSFFHMAALTPVHGCHHQGPGRGIENSHLINICVLSASLLMIIFRCAMAREARGAPGQGSNSRASYPGLRLEPGQLCLRPKHLPSPLNGQDSQRSRLPGQRSFPPLLWTSRPPESIDTTVPS